MPSDGIIIENSNQFLDSQNGHVRLELVFAETKENVCVSDAESAQVLLGPDAVTDVQCITRDLQLPNGSYELAIELHCTHGDTKWALRILDRPDLEVLHGSILRHKEHDRVDTQTHAEFDVVVVADSSGSMKPIPIRFIASGSLNA